MENENLPNNEQLITEQDFVFVQKDESIHDKKFQTRPTTFFRDAMKRFVKNKSSVVASVILGVLILMAIVVPLADRNNIAENNMESQYLPPKWFDGDLGGFLDGTKVVDNVVLDPYERDSNGNYVLPSDSIYYQNAIIGDITARSSFANDLSDGVKKYGKGGDILINNVGVTDPATETWSADLPAGILSPLVTFSTENEVSLAANLDYAKIKASLIADSQLMAYLAFAYDSTDGLEIVHLTDPIGFVDEEINKIECANISEVIEEKTMLSGEIDGYLGILVEAPEDVKYTVEGLYVTSLTATSEEYDLSLASFNDATKALAAIDDNATNAFTRYGSAKLSMNGSEVLYGSFRYDFYKGVFGSVSDDDPKLVLKEMTFTGNDVDEYVAKGWMTYTWGEGDELGVFALTEEGKQYCPIRSVVSQRVIENPRHKGDPEYTSREMVAKASYYRYLAHKGYISSYSVPKYIFGTDKNGLDFFKVVFSGLLMSLGLGFMSALINIFIGLIWGAIAGYFGGWVDLLMERFVEILSGMPWIVMMTLIVLLTGSNSFGIFLLALCITGWIGISGVTRSQFYRYKRREYVLASRTLGASDGRLIFRHILPNAIGTIVTSAVLMIPGVIFTEANIAYLLPGTMQLNGSFGVTLSEVQGDLQRYPYLIVSASIIMALIMICFNLFGNGLRDAFNPSLKGGEE